jgi:hypothetical protein
VGSNIREFQMGLSRFKADIDVNVGKLHRAVALEGLKGVVRMNPVDTGRMRANWQVTQDVPATDEVEAEDKGGGKTIAAGSGVIAGAPPYSVTYIANNVPYAEAIENGSSKQAPAGMLNVTYQRLVRWLQRQR